MFNGTEGAHISLGDASVLTANHRAANPGQVLAHFFGKNILQEILTQDGCVGIRIYLGQDESGTSKLVIVGADSGGNDMIDGVIGDFAYPCPSHCGNKNSLNSSEA